MSKQLRKTKTGVLLGAFYLMVTSTFASDLEVVYKLGKEAPPANIAITQDGRTFISTHFLYGTTLKVLEVNKDGSTTAYPSEEFSSSLNPVLGIVASADGILWILETASEETGTGRLIGWDTMNNKLNKVVYLADPLLPAGSFLNDLSIDLTHNTAYLADVASPSTAALLVVDLDSGEVRRLLQGTRFTQPEDEVMVIEEKEMLMGGQSLRIGINPITLDANDEWVYFGAMSGTTLYRAKTVDLINAELSASELESRVEDYAEKPLSDGITIDADNNIYVTDITNSAVGVINTDRQYRVLFQDSEQLAWPDGFANGPSGDIYVTVNKLHRSAPLNDGVDETNDTFYIARFKALGPLPLGR